jgi:hypothetical protein
VERVVAEILSPRLDEIRAEVGWNLELEGDEESIRKEIAKAPSDRGIGARPQGHKATRPRRSGGMARTHSTPVWRSAPPGR